MIIIRKMINLCCVFCALLLLQSSGLAIEKTKTIKLLTVGNSFAWNATKYLDKIVKSVPGCKLIMSTANDRGCYLAGSTWFEILFGRDARKISFTPESLDAKDAEFLREIAHKTASTFKQVK